VPEHQVVNAEEWLAARNVPKGRGEEDGRPQSWVRRHDEYERVS
jgi:hypothetical protein